MSNTITLPLNVVYQLEFMLRELADKSYETLETLNELQSKAVAEGALA